MSKIEITKDATFVHEVWHQILSVAWWALAIEANLKWQDAHVYWIDIIPCIPLHFGRVLIMCVYILV